MKINGTSWRSTYFYTVNILQHHQRRFKDRKPLFGELRYCI
jgi:hypothetical protein